MQNVGFLMTRLISLKPRRQGQGQHNNPELEIILKNMGLISNGTEISLKSAVGLISFESEMTCCCSPWEETLTDRSTLVS